MHSETGSRKMIVILDNPFEYSDSNKNGSQTRSCLLARIQSNTIKNARQFIVLHALSIFKP